MIKMNFKSLYVYIIKETNFVLIAINIAVCLFCVIIFPFDQIPYDQFFLLSLLVVILLSLVMLCFAAKRRSLKKSLVSSFILSCVLFASLVLLRWMLLNGTGVYSRNSIRFIGELIQERYPNNTNSAHLFIYARWNVLYVKVEIMNEEDDLEIERFLRNAKEIYNIKENIVLRIYVHDELRTSVFIS